MVIRRLRGGRRLIELLTPRENTHDDRTTDRTARRGPVSTVALTQYSRTAARMDTATSARTATALAALHRTCRQWEDEARTLGASPADLADARRPAAA
jgi:hypothetical protein